MISYSALIAFVNHFGDWFLAILCSLCVLAHLACLRSPDIQEQPPKEMGRRIKIAGLLLVAMSWWMRLLAGIDIVIALPVMIGWSMLFFGELLMTVFRLYEHREVFLPERRKAVVATVVTTVMLTPKPVVLATDVRVSQKEPA